MVIRAGRHLADDRPDDLARWYIPWARLLGAYRQDLDLSQASPARSSSTPLADGESEKIEQQLRVLQGRLEGTLPGSLDARIDGQAETDLPPLDSRPAATYVAVPGPELAGPSLRLNAHADPHVARVAAGWGLFILGALGGWSMGRRSWQSFVAQWWPVGGVTLGLFWWLCLVPSLAGWLIVAISLYGALRRGHAV